MIAVYVKPWMMTIAQYHGIHKAQGAGRPISVLAGRTRRWGYLKTATPACQSVDDVKVAVDC